ncbi:enoyl-CoA hydratase/isomerase family protein [Bosea vestrisii]|uniref:enoyl-CoA hydratase/isomerase family protein n=1 Tax=Bosea vestrisii TaxID=151416 RepID=UPI0024DF84D6|nr:enoyl-CoA hydratase/isomerase family protein [Bosea vestrisii]WID96333.1 enoyl-CoA hydratase/isomerase family protein [Bosea vestrisii]
MSDEPDIICETRGSAGFVVLNRPKALNALNLVMVRELAKALDAWEHDPAVTRIVVTGAGEKAFCAGGDIRSLHDLGKAGQYDEMLAFWREEYILNARIQSYPKPYVALVDGIVMGGGVGLSLHGNYRVAGERWLFAMPEVSIGFFPDVGATYALPRLPDHSGTYLALTGDRVGQADALALGLATHAVPSARMAELAEALTGSEPVDVTIARFAGDPGPGKLAPERATIAHCFGAATLLDVLGRLGAKAAAGDAFAAKALATIRAKSPTSVAIAFEQMRRGASLNLAEAMQLEFRIVSRISRGHDFYEGVRAVVIDKDQAPSWRPQTLEELDPADVAAYFAPLGATELVVSG